MAAAIGLAAAPAPADALRSFLPAAVWQEKRERAEGGAGVESGGCGMACSDAPYKPDSEPCCVTGDRLRKHAPRP